MPPDAAIAGVSRRLQSSIDKAGAIIHGHTGAMDQSAVDAILNG